MDYSEDSEDFHNLSSSPKIAMMVKTRSKGRKTCSTREGNVTAFRRPRRRLKDNIKGVLKI
jgi:hypothetical protein